MTDKTDIAALTLPVRDRYDWSNAVWRDCDHCGKQHTGTVAAEDGSQICAHCADQLYWSAWQVLAERAIDLLEAERQRADDAQRAGDNARSSRDLHHKVSAGLNERLIKAEAELAELKAEQVPVGIVRKVQQGLHVTLYQSIPEGTELFTAPQKPVISKEKLCDWLEDNFDIDDSQRDAFANCFAHHCNCIVKEGE